MVTLFVRHDVSDFDKWKKAYDDFEPERQSMGVKDHAVFRENDKPNNVTVFHKFENMDAAEDFVSNPRLLTVMKEGGVVGPPTLWFTHEA